MKSFLLFIIFLATLPWDVQGRREISRALETQITSATGPLSAQEQQQVEHYAKLFSFTATGGANLIPPHFHDSEIALYALQLHNFFWRAWYAGALNPYQTDRATLIAQAQQKDQAGGHPPVGGNPQFANNWQELVEKRLAYTEAHEITLSRKKALELLLPVDDWVANNPPNTATNPSFLVGYDGLLESIDCVGTRSAVYNSFFDQLAKALACHLNIQY